MSVYEVIPIIRQSVLNPNVTAANTEALCSASPFCDEDSGETKLWVFIAPTGYLNARLLLGASSHETHAVAGYPRVPPPIGPPASPFERVNSRHFFRPLCGLLKTSRPSLPAPGFVQELPRVRFLAPRLCWPLCSLGVLVSRDNS